MEESYKGYRIARAVSSALLTALIIAALAMAYAGHYDIAALSLIGALWAVARTVVWHKGNMVKRPKEERG